MNTNNERIVLLNYDVDEYLPCGMPFFQGANISQRALRYEVLITFFHCDDNHCFSFVFLKDINFNGSS